MRIVNSCYYIYQNRFYPSRSLVILKLKKTLRFCIYNRNFGPQMHRPEKK